MSSDDPTVTDPDFYKVIFENERVRVVEYRDQPGGKTHPNRHPDSVMYTLTAFRRRVSAGDQFVDLEIPAGAVRWISAQEHSGHNTGDTKTHCVFVELKEPPSSTSDLVWAHRADRLVVAGDRDIKEPAERWVRLLQGIGASTPTKRSTVSRPGTTSCARSRVCVSMSLRSTIRTGSCTTWDRLR